MKESIWERVANMSVEEAKKWYKDYKQMEENMKIRRIAGTSTERMLEPDPLEKILREARKKVEKRLKKAFEENNTDDIYKYLRTYRTLTKLINREPLSIFDF